jgi:hypothetical protein
VKWHYHIYFIQSFYQSTSQDCPCSFQEKESTVDNLEAVLLYACCGPRLQLSAKSIAASFLLRLIEKLSFLAVHGIYLYLKQERYAFITQLDQSMNNQKDSYPDK